MRIVYDIETPMQVGGGGTSYGNGPGRQGYNGTRLDLIITTDCAANHPDLPARMFEGEDNTIYIEGHSKYIIEMLEDLLRLVRDLDDWGREQYGDLRPTNCPDGCEGIEKFNGLHAVDCPRHPNYEILKNQEPPDEL